nr:hypothetical protein CFP56_37193 [Quercus suber]
MPILGSSNMRFKVRRDMALVTSWEAISIHLPRPGPARGDSAQGNISSCGYGHGTRSHSLLSSATKIPVNLCTGSPL